MQRAASRGLAMLLSIVFVALASMTAAGSASAAPRTSQDPAPVPVTGTLADGTGSVDGTFDIERFTTQDGTLMAVGEFTGTVTDAAGNVTEGSQQIALPVDLGQSSGSCEVLDLVLGPLDLNLLGLQVDLDTVHLNITAQSGPGMLLGNLLCAVSGLLDANSGVNAVLGQIATLLNRVLGALG